MAKAHRIESLSASDPYATAAAKVIEIRVGELVTCSAGVLDVGEIDRVHDMRVATRRLRAVLEIFRPCFPRGEIKAALRQVKALGDALGERRDRDVAIAGLEEIAGLMALPDRTGVETLTERLRAEQHEANEKLARFISPDRLSAIVDQLSELVAGLDRGPAHQGSSVAVELSRVELSDGVAVTTAEGRA